MHRLLQNRSTLLWFLVPGLTLYIATVLVPIGSSAYYSLVDWSGIGDPEFVGIENYMRMFTDAALGNAIVNTLLLTVAELVLVVGGGLLLAWLLTKIYVFRQTLVVLYCVPIIVSTAAMAQMFKIFLSVRPPGIVNSLLAQINPAWIDLEWLTNPDTSLAMVALVTSYRDVPIYMLIFYAALLNVPPTLMEAARIDGAGAFRTFVSIQIPYILPIVGAVAFLVLNDALRAYDIPALLTAGGPISSSEVQSLYMYKQLFQNQNYGYGSAIAMLIVVMSMVLGFVITRSTDRKIVR
ncbi:carbohydrate ABC transporter permease [Microbacterium sp. CIAB417]|uniref:carbohydrate ABC transporter permease n=1 Tax=Microbacterium sp. CIAB417 TaxID=2860287 RepID=UPI001FAD008F|nr:sugar ABC transporter permease [Microbacterium sp. CIAB417]